MDRETPSSDLLSGAIDFDRLERTATGLQALVQGPGFVPIRSKFRTGAFPDLKVHTFAVTGDYGFVINVWAVRNPTENYHLVGGVKANVDKSEGYMKAYQRVLDETFASEEQAQRAFAVLDHVITEYLLKR